MSSIACGDPLSMAEQLQGDNIPDETGERPDLGYKSGYRDAAVRSAEIMNRMGDWIICAKNKAVAVWQAAFAIGLNCCDGNSMTAVAKSLGVTRACISKGAREFCEQNDLPPSFYMKSEEAVKSYKETRSGQVREPTAAGYPADGNWEDYDRKHKGGNNL